MTTTTTTPHRATDPVRGVGAPPASTAPSAFYAPGDPAPIPREPGRTDDHHRLLQTLSSAEVSTVALCEIHTLTLAQIAELTGSPTFEHALDAAERIAHFRLRLLRLEAEQLAWARLIETARRNPINAREAETARKAAAQILRELKKPQVHGAGGNLPPDRPKGDARDTSPPPGATARPEGQPVSSPSPGATGCPEGQPVSSDPTPGATGCPEGQPVSSSPPPPPHPAEPINAITNARFPHTRHDPGPSAPLNPSPWPSNPRHSPSASS